MNNTSSTCVVLGRKKAFEGVIKAVSARSTALSLKARGENETHRESGRPTTPLNTPLVRQPTEEEEPSFPMPGPEQDECIADERSSHFDLVQFNTLLENSAPPAAKSHPLPRRKAVSYNDPPPQKIIYSTSSSLSSTPPMISHPDRSSLLHVSVIPLSGLSEEEELDVVGPRDLFDEEREMEEEEHKATEEEVHLTPLRWATSISTPVFLPEPAKSEIKVERIKKPSEEDRIEPLPSSIEHVVRRKPAPPTEVVVPPLLVQSREAQLSKIIATRPTTTSLLSFTDDTPHPPRRRRHPERSWRTRHVTSDRSLLRKSCVERRRLVRVGLLLPPPPPPRAPPPKYFLYPRAGSLRALRSDDSTACAEDFYLGYVDLSFIRKTLFAFDMRMRTGGDLWAEEVEEIYHWFGREREWEVDWDTRWKVATWLLNQPEEDEGDYAAGVGIGEW